jgi:hypothetical protein
MKFNGTAWVTVGAAGFTPGQANYMTIAIDASGTPYVGYGDMSITPMAKETVMKFDGSSWVLVGSKGFTAGLTYQPAMTLDADGHPYVVYSDWSLAPKQKATVMKFDGSAWSVVGSIGISTGTVFNPNIGVDKAGNVYIAYEDVDLSTKAVLKKFSGGSWSEVGATSGFSAGETDYLSMAMDSHGNPYMVYSDTSASGGKKATVMNYMVNTAVPKTTAQQLQLTAFPNPSNGNFTLLATKSTQYKVVDAIGHIVETGELSNRNNFTTQVKGLERGIYFIMAGDEMRTTVIVAK